MTGRAIRKKGISERARKVRRDGRNRDTGMPRKENSRDQDEMVDMEPGSRKV